MINILNWPQRSDFCDLLRRWMLFCAPPKNNPRIFGADVKESITFVMIRGSLCSAPPLSVKPQGAFPWSSTSTSSSSCEPEALLRPSSSLHHFILSAGTLRWSLGSTESMTLAVQPLKLVQPENLEYMRKCQRRDSFSHDSVEYDLKLQIRT